jgi:hypothetical protein
MDHTLLSAVIGASAAFAGGVIVAAANYYFSIKREREADWRKLKFDRYQEFIIALSGVVQGRVTREAQLRYADAVNSMSLVASLDVLLALRAFQQEISYLNQNRTQSRHDEKLNILVQKMRADIRPSRSIADEQFNFTLLAAPPNDES